MNQHLTSISSKHRKVFRLIHAGEDIDRATISKLLDLNASSVAYVVKQLIQLGLVRDGGRIAVPRGQPKIGLETNPDVFRQIGVSIDSSLLSIGITDLQGKVLLAEKYEGDFSLPRETCSFIEDKIKLLLSKAGVDQDRVLGVGIALPGNSINHGEYMITPDALVQWSGFKTASILSNILSLPVFVENDAKAGAIGELLSGSGKSIASFYYLMLGGGIGGAYVENNKLVRGSHGNLGEMGAILPAGMIRPTMTSLCDAMGIEYDKSSHKKLNQKIGQNAETFDVWFDQAMANFNSKLDIVSKLFRPDSMIISSKFPKMVTDKIVHAIRLKPYKPARYNEIPQPKIILSELEPSISEMLGASLVPVHKNLY